MSDDILYTDKEMIEACRNTKVGLSDSNALVMRLKEIEARLNSTTKPGPWKAAKGGSKVFEPTLSNPNKPYFSSAEDDCILDANEEEVIGCSEWMRVEWEDLTFMAEARSDIEFLIAELRKLIDA